MDRKTIREFTHKADDFLKVSDTAYKQWVFRYTFLELEKDLVMRGDITTNAVFHENFRTTGEIIAKEDMVVAGINEIRYFLIEADPNFRRSIKSNFEMETKVVDGQKVKKGTVIMKITADVHDLMAVERVVVNLLMRMSAVATFTDKIVEAVKALNVLICPTRKTLWGLLDKRAVVLGGGGTHRLSLADSMLVKDNHLALIDHDFGKLFKNIGESGIESRFLEVEVESEKMALEAAKAFKKSGLKTICALMLDNMTVEEVAKTLERLKKEKLHEDFLIEASGGITEKNVSDYAKTGVDIISMGCLTTGVKNVDISMEIKK